MNLKKLFEALTPAITFVHEFKSKRMEIQFPAILNLSQFWLDHAKEFTKVSKGDWQMEMKQCYTNSATLAIASPSNIKYMEGYLDFKGIPIEHAWVEQKGIMKDYTLHEDAKDIASHHYYGIYIPTKLVLMATKSKYWIISEGVLNTLQMMLLRDSTGRTENIVRKEFGLPVVVNPSKIKEKKL
jgi:hypothetical protein